MQDEGDSTANLLKIGEWQVEPQLGLIRRGETTVNIRPRAMDVLVQLQAHAPNPISTEQLIQACWAPVVVGDDAVQAVVKELRKALGDDARHPQYIETVTKRGYRIIATVEGEPEPRSRDDSETALAVLPFDAPADEFLGDGIAENILNGLMKKSALKVIAKTSSFQFRGKDLDVREIGAILQVTHVLEGSVRHSGNNIRASARLIDTRDGAEVWAEQFDRDFGDIFAVEADIATSVLRALNFYFAHAERIADVDPAAYAAYVEGQAIASGALLRRQDIAEEAFHRALAIDPNFIEVHQALAASNLAKLFNRQRSIDDAMPDIERHLDAVLALDPANLGVRVVRSIVQFCVERDLQGGIDECADILAHNPHYHGAFNALTVMCRAIDRNDLMVRAAKKCVALDPLNVRAHLRLAEDLLWAGYYDEGEQAANELGAFGYGNAHLLATAALLRGDENALEAQILRPVEQWDSPDRRLLFLAELAHDRNDTAGLERYITELRPFSEAERDDVAGPSNLRPISASIALLEGDPGPAIEWFERSLTVSLQGIWMAPAGPCRNDQPRGINLDRRRYPEIYAHPDRHRILEKYGLDPESILQVEVPELPL